MSNVVSLGIIENIGTSKEYLDGWFSYFKKPLSHYVRIENDKEYKRGFDDARIHNKYIKNIKNLHKKS